MRGGCVVGAEKLSGTCIAFLAMSEKATNSGSSNGDSVVFEAGFTVAKGAK